MSPLDATLDDISARSGSSPTAHMADSEQHQQRRGAKRLRLSVACNRCRARKVRCDSSLPKCHNCINRNEVCETTDLRNPGGPAPAVRQLAPSKSADRNVKTDAGATADQIPDPDTNSTSNVAVSGPADVAVVAANSPSQAGAPHVSRSAAFGLASQTRHRSERDSQFHRHRAKPCRPPAKSTNAGSLSWLQRAYNASSMAEGPPDARKIHESPAADGHSPDLVVNTDGTPHRVKFMGGSSLQCLCRFVDLHLSRRGLKPASTHFKHGMQRSEELDLPLRPEFPDFPPLAQLQNYLDIFFDRLWPLFPVVDRPTLDAGIDRLSALQLAHPGTSLSDHATTKSAPTLAITYAIVCIAADEINGRISETGVKYLTAAYGLYAQLISSPHLESIQAMFLLALALRGQSRDGQAWHIIGHTIRTSHSIGLHQHITDLPIAQDEDVRDIRSLRRRVWWSCFALEKLMQLESGRPSAINDLDDADQRRSRSSSRHNSYDEAVHGGAVSGQDHFTAWIALAQIIGRICHHIYCRKTVSSWHLLSETARLDQALVDWERSLPDSLKLANLTGSEPSAMHHDPLRRHLSGFILQQFCHAQIALLRAALVFPPNSYEQEVTKHADSLPSASRLLNSANLCADAARKAITTVMFLADNGINSILLGPNPPFLGAIVLALCILRQPTRRLARADLELLRSATVYVEDVYTSWGYSEDFIRGCALLKDRVQAVLDHLPESPSASSRRLSVTAIHGPTVEGRVAARLSSNLQSNSGDTSVAISESLNASSLEQPLLDGGETTASNGYECMLEDQNHHHDRQAQALFDPWLQPFDGVQFENIWSMVGSDFYVDHDHLLFTSL